MEQFSTLLQQGNAWLFIPSAVLLGILHGLEPGHSKTMMAAFIVAVRGTVGQAILLGLSATVSHTLVVWAIALLGLHFGKQWNADHFEPYFQLTSAIIIILVAIWMLWRTYRDIQHHDHDHHHHDHSHDHEHNHSHHGQHHHDHDFSFTTNDYQDAHERAHAEDIHRRFSNRNVTTIQIFIFGLTGGLIPCPASITVLLLCLQLKQAALGATLVFCFSIGLAITMVTSGTLAALSVRHASKRWRGFGEFTRKAPYLSGALMVIVGLYLGFHGVSGIQSL